VNFFTAIQTQTKISESRAKFHEFLWRIALVCPKFLKNSPRIVFFLKFHVRISTEFGTKCDKLQVKRMSIHPHPRKKSNSFTHKRTFLSALAVMNKKFIANLVG